MVKYAQTLRLERNHMENLFNEAEVNDYGYYSDRRKSISDAEPWEYVSTDALEAAVDAHAVFPHEYCNLDIITIMSTDIDDYGNNYRVYMIPCGNGHMYQLEKHLNGWSIGFIEPGEDQIRWMLDVPACIARAIARFINS